MSQPSKKSILLIDDDPLVLKTLSRLLEKCGYFVLCFENSVQAMEEMMMEDFDLIISDIRMPEIDGIQTIRYFRESRAQIGKPDIPEILITGYAKDFMDEANKLKPQAVVHKPIDLNEFLEVVKECFK